MKLEHEKLAQVAGSELSVYADELLDLKEQITAYLGNVDLSHCEKRGSAVDYVEFILNARNSVLRPASRKILNERRRSFRYNEGGDYGLDDFTLDELCDSSTVAGVIASIQDDISDCRDGLRIKRLEKLIKIVRSFEGENDYREYGELLSVALEWKDESLMIDDDSVSAMVKFLNGSNDDNCDEETDPGVLDQIRFLTVHTRILIVLIPFFRKWTVQELSSKLRNLERRMLLLRAIKGVSGESRTRFADALLNLEGGDFLSLGSGI